jgi:hypothetical protein
MHYLLLAVILIFLLSYVSIRWAINDMTTISDAEAWKLTTGDMIRTKSEEKEIVIGRIAYICHDEGWGILKEARPPHQAQMFYIKEIREKL